MPRPVRMPVAHQLYFVTNRTFQSRLLLTPSPYVNSLVGGVIAHALRRFDVALHAFVFLSNHYHLIVSAPTGDISGFVGYIQANIAKEVGRHRAWRGDFWHRRFSAEPILDDDALERRLAYIFSHGVKEGLVDRAAEWPGLTCIPELCHTQRRLFPWYCRTAQYWARQRGEDDREALFATTAALSLTPFPSWLELGAEERQKRARRILEEAQARASGVRSDRPSLGREAVMAQDPHAEPLSTKRSPRPLCHASTKAAFEAFRAVYGDFLAAYREASALLRKGRVDVEFPEHCYRPPLPRNWMPTAPPRVALA